jgi:hypothetical protein
MFINMTVELTYGIVRVRVLLMHSKALLYDLEFLNNTSGKLYDLIQTVILWRNNWFEKKPDKQTIKKWIEQFYGVLSVFLKTMLQVKKLYLPKWANLSVAKNMRLVPSEKFGYTHEGMTLPAILGDLGKKYFNIQHRFNKFIFLLPITNNNYEIQKKRFEFQKQMKEYNTRYINHFSPLNSCLNVI